MPKEFEDMVSAIKKSLKKENPTMSDDKISQKAYAMATAQWKKSHGGKAPTEMLKEKIKDWRLLEFYVPIEEKITDNDDFIIRGVAINETTTLNNVKYVADELLKAAPSFRNVPILLDHKNEVKNIVGRTTERVNFNPSFNRIDFEAKIMDKDIKEMIRDGRIGSVSIGAKVDDLIEEEDGSMKAIGIRGLEISLVAVPGDTHANLAQAIQYGYHLKEMSMKKSEEDEEDDFVYDSGEEIDEEVEEIADIKLNKQEKNMAEETSEKIVETVVSTPIVTSDKVSENKMESSEISDMKKQISELKDLLVAKQELKNQIKVDETKGEVSIEKRDVLDSLNSVIVEKAKTGYLLYRDYTKESADTKLKRLVR